MNHVPEQIIMAVASLINLALLIYAVDWRYFRDWVVIYFFKGVVGFTWGSAVVSMHLLEYPYRLLPQYYETCIFFELWIFPTLCVLYNQATMKRGILPSIGFAALFSAGMTAIEYPLELYTELIKYQSWSWFTTFYTLIVTFLLSKLFITLFRKGCDYFENAK